MSARGRGASPRGSRRASWAVDDDYDDGGDGVKVHYRFSAVAVRRVVEALSPEQEELVRSIGFGGLLHLKRYYKLDRHFSAWLCNQLRGESPPATASGGGVFLADGAGAAEVPVTARDVHEVLGVPLGERPVGRGGDATEEEDAAAVRRALGLGPGDALTLPVAEAVLGRRPSAPGPMTQAERDAFVVAFVLFAAGHFLAPPAAGRRDKVNQEVFHALANPSEVGLFNWAQYVLEELRRCAGRVREQVAAGFSKISLSGCLLFLQIFYLDRLDFEAASGRSALRPRRGDGQPRVADYNQETLRQLIEMDRKPEWPEGGLKQFGKLKFIVSRPPAQTNDTGSTSMGPPQPCLNSANSRGDEDTDMLPVTDDILNEFELFKMFMKMKNRSPMVSKLNDSPCSASSCKRPHAWQDLPGNEGSHSHEDTALGLQRLPDLDVRKQAGCNANSAVDSARCDHPDSMGFKSNATFRVLSRSNKDIFANIQTTTQREVPTLKRSRLHDDEIQECLASTEFPICEETYLLPHIEAARLQTTSEVGSEDLLIIGTNTTAAEAWHTLGGSSQKIMSKNRFGRSPFEMKLVHPEPPRNDAEACFKWLRACSNADDQLSWTWVIHEEPTSIKLAGSRIKPQLISGGDLKSDVCNLVMRLYTQLDDQIYRNRKITESRWRHFLPAEWASLALQHDGNISELSTVSSMFVGQHITYNVELCRMIIAPVELKGTWSCYVWDFMEKKLNILDPLLNHSGSNLEEIKNKHSESAALLLRSLLACRSQYCNTHRYDQQECRPDSWDTEILMNFGGSRTFFTRNTGMYTLFYAREFDGEDLHQKPGERTMQQLRRDLLYQLLTMCGNTGRRPSIVNCPSTAAPLSS
ncbi:hypothetical protein EJB05_30409, partial [Eragrostis curvula]